jgi:hypothetical protein
MLFKWTFKMFQLLKILNLFELTPLKYKMAYNQF